MGNVYKEGKADERQSEASVLADDHKLFRKRYRQLNPEEIALHDAIKDKASELAFLIGKVKPAQKVFPTVVPGDSPEAMAAASRISAIAENDAANVTLALRHLEDCVYRAVKALTA